MTADVMEFSERTMQMHGVGRGGGAGRGSRLAMEAAVRDSTSARDGSTAHVRPGSGAMADARTASAAWESLFRAQVAIMRRLQTDDIWDSISMREYDVLFTLSRGPADGLRLRDLNRSILISQPSLSRMVDRLEHGGLVTRASSPDDARGTVVRLTPAGVALQREMGRRHVRAIQRYVAGALTEQELATLTNLTDRLRLAQDGIPD